MPSQFGHCVAGYIVGAYESKTLKFLNARRLILLLVFFCLLNSTAFAHPMGNFSVNCYSKLEPYADKLEIQYVLDMAEIPTLQEKKVIDINQDGIIDGKEQTTYLKIKSQQLKNGLSLHINGKPIELQLLSKNIKFLPGQGDLSTLRLEMQMEASFKKRGEMTIEYTDNNYHERPGWKEIIANPGTGMRIVQSNVSEKDLTNALTSYPEEMTYKPLGVLSARIVAAPAVKSTSLKNTNKKNRAATAHKDDRFTQLIKSRKLTPGIVMIAIFASIGLGAFHALSPGHGKSIVAAYLVGAKGTVRHALFLGGTVTLTHTFGVFVLGLVTLFASSYILPEQLFPWISIASGAIVFFMGIVMFITRTQGVFRSVKNNHYLNHQENFNHDRDHPPNIDKHLHAHDVWKHDDHDHHHGHSHMTRDNDGSPVTWRQLLALGVSGGILPCPSALVVLLGAISLHRIGFGLLLILAFSIGLASVLTGIGVLFVKARQFLDKIQTTGPVLKLLPALSALVIMILGIGITVNALNLIV